MKKPPDNPSASDPSTSSGQALRRLAEKRLSERQRGQKSEVGGQRSAEDTARLVHELQVHQIELEMQNEELRQTRARAEQLIRELQAALALVKQLTGLLPICATCKKIRNDEGYWKQLEEYVESHSEATFTHGMCPECLEKFRQEVELLQSDRDRLPVNGEQSSVISQQ